MRSACFSLVGCFVVCLAISSDAWCQSEWIKTWVLQDNAYRADTSAMAIRYDAGKPEYHFVYEKVAVSDPSDRTDRRLYYRRYNKDGEWEDELEISNRIRQPAKLTPQRTRYPTFLPLPQAKPLTKSISAPA